jgi:hypothetical protein
LLKIKAASFLSFYYYDLKRTFMKTQLLRICMLAVAAAVAGHAQNLHFRVNVPFEFIVGTEILPAGQYAVDMQAPSGRLSIQCLDHKASTLVLGFPFRSAYDSGDDRLVFNRYADTYFLSKVWGYGSWGRKLPMTKRERELSARRITPNGVTVTASR